MKRHQPLKHLTSCGCFLVREGARHSWWSGADRTKRSAVPRHNEIRDLLARKICRDLGVPPME